MVSLQPNLLLATLLLPLAGAVLAAGDRIRARQSALVTTVLTSLLAALLVSQYPPGAEAFAKVDWSWLGWTEAPVDIHFSIALDGLSLWLYGLTSLLMVVAVLVSWDAVREHSPAYYRLLLLLETGMLGVFVARDIILFYVFFEFTLIPLFFLIGIWGSEERRHAAVKFFLFTLAGSVLTFLGLVAIVLWDYYASPGRMTFSIPQLAANLAENPMPFGLQLAIFLALFAGFAIKVPLFPLHTWLPLAHVQAPTAGSVILAGVLLKVGTYGFVRFNLPMLPEATAWCMPWLLGLSVAGIVYGALVALAQEDMKRLIAYSSVSHLGFCMLGVFSLNRLGVQGGVLQMINHGLSTGGLFALVGMLYERYHTRQIRDYGGIARRLPVLAFFMLVMTLSSIGLPGLNGFAGEFLLLLGMFQRAWTEVPPGWTILLRVIAVVAVSGVILGAWYMLNLVQRVFFGPLREPSLDSHHEHPPVRDLNIREVMALSPLVVFIVWIGIQPSFFLERMTPTLNRIAAQSEKALQNQIASETPTAAHLPSPVFGRGAGGEGSRNPAAASIHLPHIDPNASTSPSSPPRQSRSDRESLPPSATAITPAGLLPVNLPPVSLALFAASIDEHDQTAEYPLAPTTLTPGPSPEDGRGEPDIHSPLTGGGSPPSSLIPLYLLTPEIILVAVAVLIYVAGAFFETSKAWSWIALAGVFAAGLALWEVSGQTAADASLLVDPLSYYVRWLTLGVAALFVLLTSRPLTAPGTPEYVGSLLLVVAGTMLVSWAGNLVLLFAGLELVSIPTYILLFLGRREITSREATAKYFYLSILSSALLLYGLSFLYGATGSMDLGAVGEATAGSAAGRLALGPMAKIALVLIVAGLGFRITAVPFHFYAPDVYQGTTHGNAGLLSIIPKIAGLAAIVRLTTVLLAVPDLQPYAWRIALALSVVTMTLGNVMALWQDNIRRLMAYSSIAHAGYLLIPLAVFLAPGPGLPAAWDGIGALLLYLLVYAVATIGTFAALAALGSEDTQIDGVDQLAGLAWTGGSVRPIMAWCLAAFMFSLAGIPPLAGFWGKLAVFSSALGAGNEGDGFRGWFIALAVIGVLNAAVAAAYYLRIIAVMFFRLPLATPGVQRGAGGAGLAAVLCGLLVLLIGVGPGPWIRNANQASPGRQGVQSSGFRVQQEPYPRPLPARPAGEQDWSANIRNLDLNLNPLSFGCGPRPRQALRSSALSFPASAAWSSRQWSQTASSACFSSPISFTGQASWAGIA
ncbi:MAG: NADH-quinone oxidoreductase subunit M [Pirellulales bacterium]|nr:NADH-quinone oxidoreductase subunit M [Pirellulales bacterium]